eukprot:1367309-Pyramimonas_sp.AAC.1
MGPTRTQEIRAERQKFMFMALFLLRKSDLGRGLAKEGGGKPKGVSRCCRSAFPARGTPVCPHRIVTPTK